ncbi:DUF4231 domain-containing protein [Rhizobium leguminosarum bv. viciae]|uniref:DUF4231 domain-containing protein n=1 Tax=Rhizobium leguminosarum TaxID=384 RepID=UPI001441BDB3|nr:DUF4231 domain-containing protein [Rhizobium leguminosarum]NKK99610.1 DUF4231 domain-containing protein [Rhizobium leguminosarum bv. viciae]
MEPLASASALQSTWSRTATKLKQTIDRTRWVTLTLSAIAALFAAVASQFATEHDSWRLRLAVASAVLLGVVSFLNSRLLGGTQVAAWTRIRAASEALKGAIYKYSAFAAPFDDQVHAAERFNEERENIAENIDDLLSLLEPNQGAGSAPSTRFAAPSEYIDNRVRKQIARYEMKAAEYAPVAKRLRRIEFALSLLAALVTAAVGVAGKNLFGLGFDFIALTSVLTTIGGAILAHTEASRYDFLIATYRATARRLDNELSCSNSSLVVPSPEWSSFVERCESILAAENGAWQAKCGKP